MQQQEQIRRDQPEESDMNTTEIVSAEPNILDLKERMELDRQKR